MTQTKNKKKAEKALKKAKTKLQQQKNDTEAMGIGWRSGIGMATRGKGKTICPGEFSWPSTHSISPRSGWKYGRLL